LQIADCRFNCGFEASINQSICNLQSAICNRAYLYMAP
jgi:hypothetical protein